MRYIAKAVALAIVLALIASNTVLAVDYIQDTVEALSHSPVYVAPGTEGTDNDTAGKLQARLNSNDKIVLVMLPPAAETGTDISTIASRLSKALGNQRIIGLAVGNKVVGYAPTLPAGVASDLMRRAKSVSNDPVTALSTFTQNVHIWQKEHPQPEPSPLGTSRDGGLPWFVWLFLLVGIVSVAVGLIKARRKEDEISRERTHFKAPDQVKDLLTKLARDRNQVEDSELEAVLYQLCVDIEKYFQSSSKEKDRDARIFKDRLTEVDAVLSKYIDVQQNRRYYNEPDKELKKGKSSIADFAQYVLESIRRGNDADLLDYTVNTNILQAQRYR